jgi:phage gpG-like protein
MPSPGSVSMELTFDAGGAPEAIARLAEFPGDRSAAMWDAIGGAMVASTQMNFREQHAPDGEAWKPSQRALRTGTQTLIEHGYLLASQTHNVLDDGVEWGSALVYAAIQQAGGTIHREAHEQSVFRKVNKRGELSGRFVKKAKANFESRHHVGAYDIHLPARPYLGISDDDETTIEEITTRHLNAALLDTSPGSL